MRFPVFAQVIDSLEMQDKRCFMLLQQAKQLHHEFRFADAVDVCTEITIAENVSAAVLDSARLLLALCENSRTLVQYMYKPEISGKKKASTRDFVTFYDVFENGYFASLAKSMLMPADESNEHKLPLTFYHNGSSKNADVIYFSSYGKYGETGLDIYKINRINDTVWSEPELLENTVNTHFDEIHPYITEDGKTLYFASNGHYGMGGFDLFKCVFNEKSGTWSQAENLGFPFSSPYDDFLYIPDENNMFACFSSMRNCSSDSIFVYKTEVNLNPYFESISDPAQLKRIAELDIAEHKEPQKNSDSITVNVQGLQNNADYVRMLKAARYYSNSFNINQQLLDSLRNKMFEAETAEIHARITQQIVDKETEIFEMQSIVSELSIYISKMEFDFITEGIQPTLTDRIEKIVNIELTNNYTKSKSNSETFGQPHADNLRLPPVLEMMPPKITERDMFGFTTKDKIIHIDDYPLPAGLIYRIQLISMPADKTPEPELFKNCSPVTSELFKKFRRYYAGLFRKNSDAESAMVQIKKMGFKDAFIAAWKDGKSITMREAKISETEKKSPASSIKMYRITIGPVSEQIPVIKLINQYSENKDISKKINPDNKIVYIIGNFTTFEQSDALREKLVENGILEVSISEITINN